MDATARLSRSSPPPTECLSSEDCAESQGGGVACDLSTLTVRHVADEIWLQLADDADAWAGEHERESNPHLCRFHGCCDERVAVVL